MSNISEAAAAPRPLTKVRDEILAAFSPKTRAFYESFVAWLNESGVCDHTLRPGDRAPDFLLPDADGRLVSLSELRARGPVVLSFFRGGWCPFCTAELCALQAALPDLAELSASLVAITPDTGDFPRELKRTAGLQELAVLSDVDYGVGLAFGVVFAPPPLVREHLSEFGIDLPSRHGTRTWMLPIPATYVIDQDGVVHDAYVEPDFTLRMEPDAIVDRLRRMVHEARSAGVRATDAPDRTTSQG